MRQTKCKRILECKLTNEELILRAKTMSQTMNKHKAAEDRLKSATSQIKAEIQQLESEINGHQVVVASGNEFRELECVITYNWDDKTRSITRPDTGEIVEVDIIPESDLQEHLAILQEENNAILGVPENDSVSESSYAGDSK